MDKGRTVIDESHCLDLGKSAPMTSSYEGYAQAVKAGIDSCTSKQRVNSTILITREIARRALAAIEKERQRRSKAGVNRHGKILSWIILLSLCIAQPNSSACQVDIFHWDRALRKPAPSVEGNFEASPHPFRLICELGPDFGNLGIRQFWFHSLRRPGNPESGNRVGLGELSSDGFVNELGEEFYLKQGCVMDDFLSVDFGRQSPANVRPAMRVSNLPRVNDALLVQERSDSLPGDCVTPLGISFALPVGCDVARYPGSESRGTGRPADPLLFDRGFIGQPLSFTGVGSVVDSEASGLFHPQTGVQIAPAKVPERRAFLLPQMRHSTRVVQSRSFVKWIKGEYPPQTMGCVRGIEYYRFLPLHNEASLFPVENSRVVQESLISGCFLSRENTRGAWFYNNTQAFREKEAEVNAGEVGCYNGGTLFVHKGGPLTGDHDDCDCKYCGFKLLKTACAQIEAKWDCNGYSWMYATEIPHACFDVLEGQDRYCRGIVFERSALPTTSVQERS